MPLVSVILPVRDGGRWLDEAVASILAQTHRNLELIVVDDHSRDAAVAGLDRSDARLLCLDNPGDGVASAFNHGLAQARGAFVARMDADDLALPQRLETQLGYLSTRPDVTICGACVELFSAQGIAGGNHRYQAWLNACRSPARIHRELFVESPIPNPTVLFRREVIERLGGYGDPDWPEDYDLYLRADAAGYAMGKPGPVLLRWRDHDARLTRRAERYSHGQFQRAKAHYLAQGRLPGDRPLWIWGAGPTGRQMHDLLHAEGIGAEGFLEVHPRRIGGRKRDLPVWPIDRLAGHPDAFVLGAVGAAGARAKIRAFMQQQGRQEGRDYLFVA